MSDSEDGVPWAKSVGQREEQRLKGELGRRGFVVHVQEGNSASELAALERAAGLREGTLRPRMWLAGFMLVVEVGEDDWELSADTVQAMLEKRVYPIKAHGRKI